MDNVQINIVHEDLVIVQAFKRVAKLIGSISINPIVGSAGISNILFVDQVVGNDGTAVVGSLINKFKTIQGALNRIQLDNISNRVVFISPGIYTENIIIPPIDGITIQGSGINETFLYAFGSTSTILFSDSTPIDSLLIKEITVRQSLMAGFAIEIEGGPSIGGSFTKGFILQNVDLDDITTLSFSIGTVNNVYFDNVFYKTQGTIKHTSLFLGNQVTAQTGKIIFDYGVGLFISPTNGKIGYILDSSQISDVDVLNLANLISTASCTFNGKFNTILKNTVVPIVDKGQVNIRSNVGDVFVKFDLTTENRVADFSLAKIRGNFFAGQTGVGVGRGIIIARNAVFTNNDPNSIRADAQTDMDIRGAQFDQSQLDITSLGTINRTIHRVIGGADPVGMIINIVPPFSNPPPAYTALHNVLPVDAIAGVVVGTVATSNILFTATSNIPVRQVDYCIISGN